MKILYGVQATGNGHITRARALSAYFAEHHIEVDYLFSGRPKDQFFDMACFGDWQCKKGLTFVTNKGRLRVWDTIKQASLRQLIKDIRDLDVSQYDAIITDFEPITAWAAKRAGKPCIGMGHQYAFHHDVPATGKYSIPYQIMRFFAPCRMSLGLHWHHFNQPILPPIACTHENAATVNDKKIMVYFGFEDPQEVLSMLKPFTDFEFVYYGAFEKQETLTQENMGHITLKPFSRTGFQADLASACGVMSNAGFELASEAIHSGKKLLAKPVTGQVEQQSNAMALDILGLGRVMHTLDEHAVREWLHHFVARPVRYPNVAKAIVEWIAKGRWDESDRDDLSRALWADVNLSLPTDQSEQAPNQFERSRLAPQA